MEWLKAFFKNKGKLQPAISDSSKLCDDTTSNSLYQPHALTFEYWTWLDWLQAVVKHLAVVMLGLGATYGVGMFSAPYYPAPWNWIMAAGFESAYISATVFTRDKTTWRFTITVASAAFFAALYNSLHVAEQNGHLKNLPIEWQWVLDFIHGAPLSLVTVSYLLLMHHSSDAVSRDPVKIASTTSRRPHTEIAPTSNSQSSGAEFKGQSGGVGFEVPTRPTHSSSPYVVPSHRLPPIETGSSNPVTSTASSHSTQSIQTPLLTFNLTECLNACGYTSADIWQWLVEYGLTEPRGAYQALKWLKVLPEDLNELQFEQAYKHEFDRFLRHERQPRTITASEGSRGDDDADTSNPLESTPAPTGVVPLSLQSLTDTRASQLQGNENEATVPQAEPFQEGFEQPVNIAQMNVSGIEARLDKLLNGAGLSRARALALLDQYALKDAKSAYGGLKLAGYLPKDLGEAQFEALYTALLQGVQTELVLAVSDKTTDTSNSKSQTPTLVPISNQPSTGTSKTDGVQTTSADWQGVQTLLAGRSYQQLSKSEKGQLGEMFRYGQLTTPQAKGLGIPEDTIATWTRRRGARLVAVKT